MRITLPIRVFNPMTQSLDVFIAAVALAGAIWDFAFGVGVLLSAPLRFIRWLSTGD